MDQVDITPRRRCFSIGRQLQCLVRAAGVCALSILLFGCSVDTSSSPASSSVASSVVSTTTTAVPSTAAPSASIATPPAPATPNSFLQRGQPTFVIGAAGDDKSDRAIAGQVELIRALVFPNARVVPDTSIDVAKGPDGWPPNPVVYGGPHVNAALAALSDRLPFRLKAGSLAIGDRSFEDEGVVLVTVVPGRPATDGKPGYPEFLLYAGTGTPGVGEINGASRGRDAIFIGDRFGMVATGHWQSQPDRPAVAVFDVSGPERIQWTSTERKLKGERAESMVTFHVPKSADSKDDDRHIAAVMRGLDRVVRKLEIAEPSNVDVYLYADGEEKSRMTGNGGDGHAAVFAHTLHVRRADPAPGGPLEGLVAHEGTHVLAYEAWGPTGTPMMGEGLAVWVSGKYGGQPLEAWKAKLSKRTPIRNLVGPDFRRMPESESYPQAGLVVEMMIGEVGLDGIRRHLFKATALDWDRATVAAGTTSERLQAAWSK
ncbi:MAG: hypothetical protein HOW73_30935 [Polyangiaceae bacterium]|nr:hypothetical protein [Polyangiaceae bacterium]